MKIVNVSWTVLLVLAAASASAARPDDEAVDKAVLQHNAQAAEPDKVVCKRIRQTGTHFKRRICQKQRDWDHLREEAQRNMRNMNSAPDGTANSGSS